MTLPQILASRRALSLLWQASDTLTKAGIDGDTTAVPFIADALETLNAILQPLQFTGMDTPERLPSISEVAEMVQTAGGHFFDRETMKCFGDKIGNWKPFAGEDGKLYIRRNHARDSSPSGRLTAGQVRAVMADGGISIPLEKYPEPRKAARRTA